MRCIACDSLNISEVTVNNIFDVKLPVVKCSDCGIAFLSVMPAKESLDRLYEKEFNEKYGQKNGVLAGISFNLIHKLFVLFRNRSYLRLIFSVMGNNGIKGKKVLEIGCSKGELLYDLKNKGADIYGVEPSLEGAGIAAQKYGVKIVSKDIDDISADEQYDLILAFHTLEHLLSPVDSLIKIRSMLKEDGVFIGEVPYTPQKIEGLDENVKKCIFDNVHTYHFSVESIKRIFKKTGYRIVRLERVCLAGSKLSCFGHNINVHYMHPGWKRNFTSKLLGFLHGIELVVMFLSGKDIIVPLCESDDLRWIGPNDWIRFILKK